MVPSSVDRQFGTPTSRLSILTQEKPESSRFQFNRQRFSLIWGKLPAFCHIAAHETFCAARQSYCKTFILWLSSCFPEAVFRIGASPKAGSDQVAEDRHWRKHTCCRPRWNALAIFPNQPRVTSIHVLYTSEHITGHKRCHKDPVASWYTATGIKM